MKDPLYSNKVAAVILVTLLLAIGLPTTITTLSKVFGGHHGGHHDEANPFGLAYIPADIKLGSTSDAPPVEKVSLAELLHGASVERGQRGVGICAACHTFTKDGADGIGPNLWDIIDREIGGIDGFSYTPAVQATEGVWSYERLDLYLKNSASYIPGTQMAQSIRKEGKRADILAYLATLSDQPVPFPTIEKAPAADHDAEAH